MFKLNFLCLNLYPIPLVLSLGIRKYKSITFIQMLHFYGVKQVKLLLFLLQSFGVFLQLFFKCLLQQNNEQVNWEIFLSLQEAASGN